MKSIGDEVMVVGSDPGTLVNWAVGCQALNAGRRPAPRIGFEPIGEVKLKGFTEATDLFPAMAP